MYSFKSQVLRDLLFDERPMFKSQKYTMLTKSRELGQ